MSCNWSVTSLLPVDDGRPMLRAMLVDTLRHPASFRACREQ